MTSEQKKAFLLLESIIFHYHGLDEEEKKILESSASELEAQDELLWANEFIAQDFITAFDRARKYISEILGVLSKEEKLEYLNKIWASNLRKGYITEMEATAMLKVARDWEIEAELMSLVRS
jgi:hypothetical protein